MAAVVGIIIALVVVAAIIATVVIVARKKKDKAKVEEDAPTPSTPTPSTPAPPPEPTMPFDGFEVKYGWCGVPGSHTYGGRILSNDVTTKEQCHDLCKKGWFEVDSDGNVTNVKCKSWRWGDHKKETPEGETARCVGTPYGGSNYWRQCLNDDHQQCAGKGPIRTTWCGPFHWSGRHPSLITDADLIKERVALGIDVQPID